MTLKKQNHSHTGRIKSWITTLVAVLFVVTLSVSTQSKDNADSAKQKEVDNYGADLDITIHRQYKFLEEYGKDLIDDDIQAVPYQINIVQPKRKWSRDDKVYTDENSVEIIEHGFLYDVETFGNEPVGRKYKTLLLKFSGDKASRKLKEVQIEVYEKNYKTRAYFWVGIKDTNPIIDTPQSYQADASGNTATDKSLAIARRSNSEDSEQKALEMAAAMSGNSKEVIKVEKLLEKMKNTPAQPLRNVFKNDFYRKHLSDFSNIVFSIYEMHRRRAKDADSYMLDFLRESTLY
jgi:hypothetical protein